MQAWWDSLNTITQFFYVVAIPATLILVIQTILTLIGIAGGENDMMPDEGGSFGDGIDPDGDGVPDFTADFRMFSVRGMVAFFSVFGWVGVILSQSSHWIITFITAIGSGFAAMLIIAYLFYGISRLQASGNIDYSRAAGKTATVYLRIPPNRGGNGKIHLILSDSLVEMNAMTDRNEQIRSGDFVRVESVMDGNIALVKPEEANSAGA